MLTPQIFETLIKRTRERFQWYSIIVSFYKPKYAVIGDNIIDIGWKIEEEVKEPTLELAYMAYNRFINHYGRYINTCKINIYAQHNGYRDRIDEFIIDKNKL